MFNNYSYPSNNFLLDFRRFIAENYNNIDLIMSKLMLSMNFSLQLKGYTYLKDAISYCFSQPDDIKINLSGKVYPYIENKRNVKAHNIERDMRNAIQVCFFTGNMLILNDIYGANIISNQSPPTVGDFITKTVEAIRFINRTYCEQAKQL